MNALLQLLMERDGLTEQEAVSDMADARCCIEFGEDAHMVLWDEFGVGMEYLTCLLHNQTGPELET